MSIWNKPLHFHIWSTLTKFLILTEKYIVYAKIARVNSSAVYSDVRTKVFKVMWRRNVDRHLNETPVKRKCNTNDTFECPYCTSLLLSLHSFSGGVELVLYIWTPSLNPGLLSGWSNIFCGFPQAVLEKAAIVPRFGHDHFLSDSVHLKAKR
jgi:hypothetical protein